MPLFRRKADKPPQLKPKCGPATPPPSRGMARNGLMSADVEVTLMPPPPSPPPPGLQHAEQDYDPRLCMRTKSRLSKTLEEVLADNSAMAYFIQFMEESGSKALIKFWIEAQSFHGSCLLRTAANCASAAPSRSKCQVVDEDDDDEVFKDSAVASTDKEKSAGDCAQIQSRLPTLFTEDALAEGPAGGPVLPVEHPLGEEAPKEALSSRTHFTCNSALSATGSNNVHNSTETDTALDPAERSAAEVGVSALVENGSELRASPARRDSLCQDAAHIFAKYIASNAPLPIGITEDLRNRISEAISEESIDPDCFLPAQKFVLKKMEKEVFPSFLRSPYNCKHQVDVLTSGNVSLADILYNDSALFYFMEYMEQEQSRHLVDFLLMADNFRKHLLDKGHYDGLQAQDDAMVIYDKYFSLQATSPLGFSDAIRLEVEQNICREEGPLPNCFEKPVMILMQHMEKNHLRHFLSSQLYVKYITECIQTIQTAQSDSDSVRWKKRSGSDSSSSDMSVASHTINTLLAMDGKQPGAIGSKRILKNIASNDMKIDTGQFNPDSLWKRSLAGKLQMAYVDHLGKVTTEFEPEPDKKTGSNLTKAFKKLVNWDVDKAEEELAWQVAEMIVKDVCAVTLHADSALDDNG
ncbi:A-kinase anchor protein 10, mitochondrial-like isoform X2 [Ornithodoros turicata]|uniref:A-kinase anchor protein 10, mitochondrial-like isoform X2 n=1 Tax=Ornithodoros turicata TaxID=34597 RepID=UPI003139DC77